MPGDELNPHPGAEPAELAGFLRSGQEPEAAHGRADTTGRLTSISPIPAAALEGLKAERKGQEGSINKQFIHHEQQPGQREQRCRLSLPPPPLRTAGGGGG